MINYNIYKSEEMIDKAITGLSPGVAYLLLKNKLLQIGRLYQQQVQSEYNELIKQQANENKLSSSNNEG